MVLPIARDIIFPAIVMENMNLKCSFLQIMTIILQFGNSL